MKQSERLKIWDRLQKKIIVNQLPELNDKIILDFGAGNCFLATLMDKSNNFICIDPNFEKFSEVYSQKNIFKINGDCSALKKFKNESVDVIFCHNVFEYLDENTRLFVIQEFCRILKKDGFISFIKHNKFGRILEQMIFKNDFKNYKSVFLENESYSERFGKIFYFKDKNILRWANGALRLVNKFGLRMFYDLQNNVEIMCNPEWENEIVNAELYFCKTDEFVNIAFLHHLILIKK